MKPYILGITGGSGSGKTYFLHKLLAHFNDTEVCLISQDNYYKAISEQFIDENGVHHFDIPSSIDSDLFAQHIQELTAGKIVKMPEYVFNNGIAEPKILCFKPAPVVVVEGIFVFYYPKVAKQLDLKIFVDAKEHIKLKRRIVRDNKERGYDLDDVLYRLENHISPSYEKYIAPFKDEADMVINNNQHLDNALDVLVAFLKSKVK